MAQTRAKKRLVVTLGLPGNRETLRQRAQLVVNQGAGDRTRTGDVQLGKLAFYQLNYARKTGQRRRLQYTRAAEGVQGEQRHSAPRRNPGARLRLR